MIELASGSGGLFLHQIYLDELVKSRKMLGLSSSKRQRQRLPSSIKSRQMSTQTELGTPEMAVQWHLKWVCDFTCQGLPKVAFRLRFWDCFYSQLQVPSSIISTGVCSHLQTVQQQGEYHVQTPYQ